MPYGYCRRLIEFQRTFEGDETPIPYGKNWGFLYTQPMEACIFRALCLVELVKNESCNPCDAIGSNQESQRTKRIQQIEADTIKYDVLYGIKQIPSTCGLR